MRQAYNEKGFMFGDDGTLVGLKLGFVFCAEHEHGTQHLARRLGVPQMEFPIGILDRLVRPAPDGLVFDKGVHTFAARRASKRAPAAKAIKVPTATLRMDDRNGIESTGGTPSPSDPTSHWHDPARDWLICMWDDRAFCIHAFGEEHVARLERLHRAFLSGDVAMGLPWMRGFLRGGLTFVIASAMSEADREAVKARDLEHKHLIESVQATGIEAELREAGCAYFALSPAWADDEKTRLHFFLNPCNQDRHNFGWFDLDDLRDWKAARGVIMGGTLLREELDRRGCGDACNTFATQVERDGNVVLQAATAYWANGKLGAGE